MAPEKTNKGDSCLRMLLAVSSPGRLPHFLVTGESRPPLESGMALILGQEGRQLPPKSGSLKSVLLGM